MFINHIPITYDEGDGIIKQVGYIYFEDDIKLHRRVVDNKDMVKR